MSGKLYPTFEELTLAKEVQAQNDVAAQMIWTASHVTDTNVRANYAELARAFLGLDLSCVRYDKFGNAYLEEQGSETTIAFPSNASLTRQAPDVVRDPADVTNAVRGIVTPKDQHGRVGIMLRELHGGIFVSYVEENSPAASSGLRFGDQILSINDKLVSGFTDNKAMDIIKYSDSDRINFVIRDRPFERNITLSEDSRGFFGLKINEGRVVEVVKDSSAARNGVLINHQILEVNGQNVVGLSDKKIREHMGTSGSTIKLTIMPSFFFQHMLKTLGNQCLKKMDRSLPGV